MRGAGPVVPLRAVRALFLARQHLDHPRQGPLTARGLARFALDVGGIQLDSINVLDRAHYLTVWTRFGPYDRATLDRLCCERRVLFEYWAHAACLVPRGHLGAWRRAMLDYEPRHTGWASWLRQHEPTLRLVEDAIRARGPLGNADFADSGPRRGSAGWWDWKPATHALDYLWKSGVLAVHSRVHFQRRLDLIERVLPEALTLEPLDPAAFRRWHVRLGLHAMGAATDADLGGYLTFPRVGVAARRRAVEELRAAGEVVDVAVAGEARPWLALAEDAAALARAAHRRARPAGTALLAPFDSFLWYRGRVARLFGFDYRIEVYTPGDRRVHGYYTLPLLHDGWLVGRVDAKHDRAAGRLDVRHAHFEPWAAAGAPPPLDRDAPLDLDGLLAGLADTLRSLAVFVGAAEVRLGRVTPTRLARPLTRALAAG
ncbi:MAG TPA: crosslink repair DNA glycosylase YcaQ family protein [Polyangia bacterium]|jgi:hypothetical protein